MLPIAKRSYKRVKTNKKIGGIKLTNYQVNQMAVSKMSDIEDFEEIKKTIEAFMNSEPNQFKKYYMLLNNELRYYTLFHRHLFGDFYNAIVEETLPDVLIECLQNIGKIKMFETIDYDHVECWVETPKDGCVVYMLFPYDEGVIEVK